MQSKHYFHYNNAVGLRVHHAWINNKYHEHSLFETATGIEFKQPVKLKFMDQS